MGPRRQTRFYAIDCTRWARCDAECSPERGFYHHPSRHSAGKPIVAGWNYSLIAQLNWEHDSWTAPIDVRRSTPTEDTTTVTATQVKDLSPASGPAGRSQCLCSTAATTHRPHRGTDRHRRPNPRQGPLRPGLSTPTHPNASPAPGAAPDASADACAALTPTPGRPPTTPTTPPTTATATSTSPPGAACTPNWPPKAAGRAPTAPRSSPAPSSKSKSNTSPKPSARDAHSKRCGCGGPAPAPAPSTSTCAGGPTSTASTSSTMRFANTPSAGPPPLVRTPQQGDRWTWLVLVAYIQLRLARQSVPATGSPGNPHATPNTSPRHASDEDSAN